MTSKKQLPDVDIDVPDRARALEGLNYTPASQMDNDGDTLRKHNSGVFFQHVPVDPITGLCAFPSGAKAGDLSSAFGFQKVDILSNTAYDGVRDPDHLKDILARPIPWEMFESETIVSQLQQIWDHHELVYAYAPKSVEELACIIALIRPGKQHLLGQDMSVVKQEVWKKEEGGYTFKKSHAIAFALLIVVQLQVLLETGNGWTFDERSDLRDSEKGSDPHEGD